MRRVEAVVAVGVAWVMGAGVGGVGAQERVAPAAAEAKRVLPGIQKGGAVLLPNTWSLRPVGRHLTVGDFPVNLAVHPGGQYGALLHAGYGAHEVMIVDLKAYKEVSRTTLPETFYGVTFAPDGKTLFASGGEHEVVHAFDFADGHLSRPREFKVAEPKEKFIPAGVATDAAGKTLYVAGPWGQAVVIVPLDAPEKVTRVSTGEESFPYGALPDKSGGRLFVSLWNKAAVAVIDLEKRAVAATWPTEAHPTEMALSPDGKTLFVACANSTKVSVLDTASGQARETIACSLYPGAPAGNTPCSLALTPDGQMLFVANADANNVAVINVGKPGQSVALGFIPAGWYPTSVRFNAADKKLYVANGKGTTPLANPQGPNPLLPTGTTLRQYIGGLFRGTLAALDVPTPERLAGYTKTAYACSPLRSDFGVTGERPKDCPIPGKVGEPSPIKYCVYIIKENRTYDQVFGDMKEGNGDPDLCLFPEKVTPNHHALAREFVLLDNFYVEGEVSADGHQWTMGAYANDFVEKAWPLSYRPGKYGKIGYPSEGNYELSVPAGGYLWDRAKEAGVTYRSYGEWIDNGKTPNDPGRARAKALEGHFDPMFRGFDMDYPDQKRADRFLEELKGFEAKGEMPRLVMLRLPNDHTIGTRVGKPTPTAMVADNDLALGRVVEGLSKSKFWKELAIFVVEDDAQNGSDHVDAHRTVALVVSPYTKRGHVDSSMYSTSSMLRTMELILGLKPMSPFDAAARPMFGSFQGKADLRPYEHKPARVDLGEKNARTAWGAELSEKFDLAKEDAADDLLFNQVIWKSVKGAGSRMPAPVRAAFFVPRLSAKDHDDDD